MPKLFVFILLCFGHIANGKDQYPTKSQLIKSLTKKTKLKRNVYNSTNWFTIESDSSYQKADTLIFYNNSHYQYAKRICTYIDWNFYRKDAFWVQRVQLCKEPTTASTVKDQDFFTYEITGNQQPMILHVFNKSRLVDTFEVLSLTKQPLNNQDNETTDVLVLRRVKTVETER